MQRQSVNDSKRRRKTHQGDAPPSVFGTEGTRSKRCRLRLRRARRSPVSPDSQGTGTDAGRALAASMSYPRGVTTPCAALAVAAIFSPRRGTILTNKSRTIAGNGRHPGFILPPRELLEPGIEVAQSTENQRADGRARTGGKGPCAMVSPSQPRQVGGQLTSIGDAVMAVLRSRE